MIAAPPIPTPGDAAEHALDDRLGADLADDEAPSPAERLERSELAGALLDACEREQGGDQERRSEGDDRERRPEFGGEVLGVDE